MGLEDMLAQEPALGFDKWVTISPKDDGEGVRTGCGIIVDVSKLPEKYKEVYNSREDNLYHVMTDFGNVMKFIIEELESSYYAVGVEKEPHARYMRQQELLCVAWDNYFVEE